MPVIDAQSAAALMDPLTALVAKAGAAVLSVNRDRMTIGGKVDGSPVTEADLTSDRIIAEGLAQLCPDIPVLSEERVHLATPPYAGSFFLIDPLDGTKEFIAGRDEFTVNLAIVTDGVPLLGIIGAPALGSIWRGLVGHGAQRLAVAPDGKRRRARSRSRPDRFPAAAANGLPPSAVHTATAARTPSSTAGPARCAHRSAPRSSSAGSRRAAPTSIPASPRPANGTLLQVTPWSPPPAARSRTNGARRCVSANRARDFWCRSLSPGAIRRLRLDADRKLAGRYCASVSFSTAQRRVASSR